MRAFPIAWLICLVAFAASAADDALWIDVRSPEEYATGHLAGAINVPHREIATRIAALVPDRTSRLKLYCRRGVRAQTAKFALESLGYQHVSNEGGYEALLAAQAACRRDASAC
ncbi:MAG TPA: rhodanese-like domain-containing protein [Gammaproteobacteria bacterium]|nr:rhodanese-like domain-containing protein [Gammaproteobacteria bacterium]